MAFRYRAEIDGLRAIAVLLVVIFHAGLGFPGGYIGVDIFFVISGFLITGIILREIQAGLFKLSNFWTRRICRILPASIFMALTVLLLGNYFLSPNDYAELSASSIAQQLMLSNVFFLRKTDYFAGPADLKPLLHTWSLSVEEQFYVVFPFLILLLARLQNRIAFVILALLSLISFALNVYGVSYYPTATFFLLPTRCWELMLGALTCLGCQSAEESGGSSGSHYDRWLGWIGLLAIFASACSFDATTPFPGFAALAPCLGASFFIIANGNRLTDTGRLLAWKPIVFIGTISYSLYLWHWPILVFLRHRFGHELTIEMRLAAVLFSFFCAVLSWRFIEKPFRESRKAPARIRQPVAIIGLGFVLALGLGGLIYGTHGMKFLHTQRYLTLIDDETWDGQSYLDGLVKTNHQEVYLIGDTQSSRKTPAIFVWGDSHVGVCVEAIDKVLKSRSMIAEFMTNTGTSPFYVGGPLQLKSSEAMKVALKNEITDVVLVGRWSSFIEGRNEYETLLKGPLKQPPESYDAFRSNSQLIVQQLRDAGKRVWIVKQVPESEQMVAHELVRAFRFQIPPALKKSTVAHHHDRQRRANELLDQLAALGANLFDPSDRFFDSEGNLILVIEGRAVYRDDDHVSRFGAEEFMRPVFEEIFKLIQLKEKSSK